VWKENATHATAHACTCVHIRAHPWMQLLAFPLPHTCMAHLCKHHLLLNLLLTHVPPPPPDGLL